MVVREKGVMWMAYVNIAAKNSVFIILWRCVDNTAVADVTRYVRDSEWPKQHKRRLSPKQYTRKGLDKREVQHARLTKMFI